MFSPLYFRGNYCTIFSPTLAEVAYPFIYQFKIYKHHCVEMIGFNNLCESRNKALKMHHIFILAGDAHILRLYVCANVNYTVATSLSNCVPTFFNDND